MLSVALPQGAPSSNIAHVLRMLANNLTIGAVLRFASQNGIALVCACSLVAYVSFSEGLRFYLAGWPYHLQLLQSWFAARGTVTTAPSSGSEIPPSAAGEPVFLALFVISCLCSAVLITRLTRATTRPGPTYILLTLGAAIIPTLCMASFWWPDGQGKLTSWMITLVGVIVNMVLLVSCLVRRRRRPPLLTADPTMTSQPLGWSLAYVVPAALLLLLAFFTGYGVITGDDAKAYHLPMAAAWWHGSRLSTGANVQLFYPGNMELLLRWALSIGSDHYSFIVAFLGVLASLYVLYEICRACGQQRATAAIAACAAIATPVLPNVASTAYSDTICTLFLLLAVFFLIEWIRLECRNLFVVAYIGLALGLSAGTKYSALPAVLMIALVWTYLMFSSSREELPGNYDEPSRVQLKWKWIGRNALVLMASAMAGGMFWYLRNFVEQGNPFYPVAVMGLPGMPMSAVYGVQNPGLEAPSWKWAAYPWAEFGYHHIYDNGVGAMFAAMGIPCLLAWWLGRPSRSLSLRMVYFITLGSFAGFVWAGNFEARYALFPIVLSFVFLGEVIERTRSTLLRCVSFASYGLMILVLVEYLMRGILYIQFFPKHQGAERFGLPARIDTLPPAKIFNAATLGAFYNYGLMGSDYRHEVIRVYRDAEPADLLRYPANYVLLTESQVPSFIAAWKLTQVAQGGGSGPGRVSLWEVSSP